MFRTDHLFQLVIYGTLGLAGTAAHYSVLLVFVEVLMFTPVIASSVGFVVGAVVNHALNRRYLFNKTRRSYSASALMFLVVASLGFLLNLGVMAFSTNYLAWHYIFAQLVATGTVFIVTFVLNKVWTFQV
ncbi:MAG: GtrA family protein [Marinobacter sp.]|uniref:GtrA family protein n=1 Tax=Marinobacter sp. TaxID=50741 RepID=UPI00299DD5AE|nr:GtrA family protein [Marinobacter sp.]MDX1634896.1 GtrA family protein [Marinobacter sp.]